MNRNRLYGKLSQRIGLTLIYLIVLLIFMRFDNAYGSMLDWCSQHIVFPEHFRQLFYDTGDVFPDLDPFVGGGQNIYYFSYYGLFSPITLLSYLVPFVDMSVYIQVMSILGVWLSVMLFHRFLWKRFSPFTSFTAALCLLCSTPLVFHSHRHIMFVSFMPFLILSIEGAEKYIREHKRAFLIVSLSLMILCSYYFAVTALLSVTAFGVYAYLRYTEKLSFKDFLKKGLGFAVCVIISIMICAVLLLPTMYAIQNGRVSENFTLEKELLIPQLVLGISGLSPHALGLSAIGILSIVAAIMSRDIAKRFLGIFVGAINIFPVFTLLLNGGMYLDGKVLIPFIPLVMILTAEKLEEFVKKDHRSIWVYLLTIAVIIISIATYQEKYDVIKDLSVVTLMTDAGIFSVCFVMYLRLDRKLFLALGAASISAVVMISAGFTEYMISFDIMNYNNAPEINKMADYIKEQGEYVRSTLCSRKADTVNMVYNTGWYSPTVYSSLSNMDYRDFYLENIRNENEYRNSALLTRSGNLLFDIFMGIKYQITNKSESETGYELIYQDGKFGFYKNDDVLPIGRSSNRLMSESYYNSLPPQRQMEALVKYIIVQDESIQGKYTFSDTPYSFPSIPESSGLKKEGNGYRIKSKLQSEADIKLTEPIPKDKLLIVFMDADNSGSNQDARVRINNTKNTLTNPGWKYCNKNYSFEFVVSTDGKESLDSLHMIFSNGNFTISNIRAYLIDRPTDIELTGRFKADMDKTHGDTIEGDIECSEDSYFQLTVPYDHGFEVWTDGVKTDIERVDRSFMGFPIKKGQHHIRFEYNSPMKKYGLIISAAGLLILIAIIITEIRRRNKNA